VQWLFTHYTLKIKILKRKMCHMCTEYHNHNCSIIDYTELPAAKDPHTSEQYEDWYIGPRWVVYNIWYTDKGLQSVSSHTVPSLL